MSATAAPSATRGLNAACGLSTASSKDAATGPSEPASATGARAAATATGPAIRLRAATPADDALRREWFLADRSAELSLPAALLELQWHARARDWAARHPLALTQLVEFDGCRVGAVTVDRSAAEGTHVIDLVVAPAHRRRGVASAVLDALAAEGRPLTLTVWAANGAARALYRKHGFVQTGQTGQTTQTAVAMQTAADGYLALRRAAREEAA